MVHVCRQLQDVRLRDQQRPTDLITESPHQSHTDNSSVQTDCQQSEMTAHLFKYNNDPVQQYVVSSGGKTSLQSEDEQCSPSLISCAEEECDCQPLQKSSVEQGVTNLQHICLREHCVFTGNVKQGDNRGGALLSRKNMQQDILAGNIVNGNCVQEMAEEIDETYTEFADGVTIGSHAVRNVNCVGDAEMNEVESSASEIHPASEVDGLDSSDKFSALKQPHLRDTGLSDYHEAEIIVISDDDDSDASTVIISSHDSMSTRVQRICEDGGSSDSMVVACASEVDGLDSDDNFSDASTVIISNQDSMVVACASEVDGPDSDDDFECKPVITSSSDSMVVDCASEVDGLDSSDDFSDASPVVSSSHDSMSTRVQRICEDGESSDFTVVDCADEDEVM
jgi:hypothetical protein